MKIKLVLIGKRDWEKVKQDAFSGEEETIKCTFYTGFDEKSKPMEFKSNNSEYRVHEVLKFDPELAQDFDLKAVFDSFKQKMKFVEIEPETDA